jgi:SsrA-binding protein
VRSTVEGPERSEALKGSQNGAPRRPSTPLRAVPLPRKTGGGLIKPRLPLAGTRLYGRCMARPRPAVFDKQKIVAENRRARYDFAIDEVFEAGIALTGTEVKSLRFGEGSIAESYAEVKDGEVWLINANVPEFSHGNRFNHEPKRPRKLLLTAREINKMFGAVMRQGMTLVPLSVYFNGRGRAKVELAIARGRKAHDKREYQQEKDWKREQGRLMRQHG